MADITNITVGIDVKFNVDYELASTCLFLLNSYLKDNPGRCLYEEKIPVDCSSVPIKKYSLMMEF